ncbi:MAG TPA: phosphoribosylaminoimidazolesuccinocarboxamide synthase [Drouetiella sp.]
MSATKPEALQLAYEGSVKRVWSSAKQSDRLWFEFTDDYSVFDWGKMPNTIKDKGRALALMGGYFFERLSKPDFWTKLPQSAAFKQFDAEWMQQQWNSDVFKLLCKHGAPTHFYGLKQDGQSVSDLAQAANKSEPVMMEVVKAEVFRPESRNITGNTVFFYNNDTSAPKRLIPLEIVFRFGMPSGSSLLERLEKNPDYLRVLGLSKQPKTNSFFEHPVVELYTKLEPKDRLLSLQEAALMADLDSNTFEGMIDFATLTALGLFALFAERSIELWDGKVEMILVDGIPLLADSIGPDELRLLYKGCHLSKELIRQIYRGGKWESSIKEAQKRALILPNKGWKKICAEDLGAEPEPFSDADKKIVDSLYPVIANHVIGSEVFENHPTLDDFIHSMPAKFISAESAAAAAKRG